MNWKDTIQATLARLLYSRTRYILASLSILILIGIMIWINHSLQVVSKEAQRERLFYGQVVMEIAVDPRDSGYYQMTAPLIDMLTLESVIPNNSLVIKVISPNQRLTIGYGESIINASLAIPNKELVQRLDPNSGDQNFCFLLGGSDEVAAGNIVGISNLESCVLAPHPREWGALDRGLESPLFVVSDLFAEQILTRFWRLNIGKVYISLNQDFLSSDDYVVLVDTLRKLGMETRLWASQDPTELERYDRLLEVGHIILLFGSIATLLSLGVFFFGQTSEIVFESGLLLSFGADNSFLSEWVTRDLIIQGVALLLPGIALLIGYLLAAGVENLLWMVREFFFFAALQLVPFALFFALVKSKVSKMDPLLLLREI